MAKKILLDVLEQTIGPYVKDTETLKNALNIKLFNGQISLKNLDINVETVNKKIAT